MYVPNVNEALFKINPIGVKYICEFCHEGEMEFVHGNKTPQAVMFEHKCSNVQCGKMLLLPKVYPYIEWNQEDE